MGSGRASDREWQEAMVHAADRVLLWQDWASMWAYAAQSNQDDPVLEKQLWLRCARFHRGCDRWRARYNALLDAGGEEGLAWMRRRALGE